MSIHCNNCFSEQHFDDNIPTGGIRLKCADCEYEYILYPSNVMIGNFYNYLLYHHGSNISGKALSIVKQNISSVEEFLKLSIEDFRRFRNCGSIISRELLEFKEILQKKLGYTLSPKNKVSVEVHPELIPIPDFLKSDPDFFEAITQKLTVKTYDFLLNNIQIDSLKKIMALEKEYLVAIKHCGWKKINEIQRIQRIVFEIIMELEYRKDSQIDDFKSMITLNLKIRELLNIGDDVNPDEPFPSLNKWLLCVSKSERNKNVFMLRMGMQGEPYQTYDRVGIKYDISRERVRGITNRIKKVGLLSHMKIRLDPLIERAEKIVLSKGGEITCSDLIAYLLCVGPDGELLKHAIPFIEYLNSFPSWQNAGLNIKDGIVYIKKKKNYSDFRKIPK